MQKICILIAACVFLYGCGEKRPLNELRASGHGVYLDKEVNVPIETVKLNIKNESHNSGSLLKYFENGDGTQLSLVRQLDSTGEIMCFVDFLKGKAGTRVVAYNYICSEKFLDDTIHAVIPVDSLK